MEGSTDITEKRISLILADGDKRQGEISGPVRGRKDPERAGLGK